jgi:hypothetical protein
MRRLLYFGHHVKISEVPCLGFWIHHTTSVWSTMRERMRAVGKIGENGHTCIFQQCSFACLSIRTVPHGGGADVRRDVRSIHFFVILVSHRCMHALRWTACPLFGFCCQALH